MRTRRLAGPALPQPIENLKTMKQRLHNDMLSLLSEKGLKWRGDEVFNVGLAFLRAIVDSLWIIDGHHDVFALRSIEIPSVFHPFSGYNLPERSKHRKRTLLTGQLEAMKRVHMSEKPARQIAENLHVVSLPKCASISPKLFSLQSSLEDKELMSMLFLKLFVRPIQEVNMYIFKYLGHLV